MTETRVLGRAVAKTLTEDELNHISGGSSSHRRRGTFVNGVNVDEGVTFDGGALDLGDPTGFGL